MKIGDLKEYPGVNGRDGVLICRLPSFLELGIGTSSQQFTSKQVRELAAALIEAAEVLERDQAV